MNQSTAIPCDYCSCYASMECSNCVHESLCIHSIDGGGVAFNYGWTPDEARAEADRIFAGVMKRQRAQLRAKHPFTWWARILYGWLLNRKIVHWLNRRFGDFFLHRRLLNNGYTKKIEIIDGIMSRRYGNDQECEKYVYCRPEYGTSYGKAAMP